MKPLLGLRDVAREAGVHFTTVSLALRNDPRLPQATRERIQQVAARLGYHSNPLVSSLISSLKRAKLPPEMGAIGFLDTLSKPTGPFRRSPVGHPFYEGALRRANELGYHMDLFQVHLPATTWRRMNTILTARGIRGLIIDSNFHPRGHLSLDTSPFTCIIRGYSSLRPNLHRVSHNHFQGILLAIHVLRHLGYRRLGLVLNDKLDKLVNNQWSAGFLSYQFHVPVAERVPFLLFRESPAAKIKRWFDHHRPDVILGPPEIFQLIRQIGLKIPTQVGYANLDLDASSEQKQSGIWQFMDKLGEAAVDALTTQMQRNECGVPSHPKLVLLEGVWREGSTVVPQNRSTSRLPKKRPGPSGSTRVLRSR